MGEVSGSKPDAVQEKKRKKKCVRSLRNKKKGELGERKIGKRQRELARGSTQSIPLLFIQSVVIINVYIQYLRELLLSSKTIERIHN